MNNNFFYDSITRTNNTLLPAKSTMTSAIKNIRAICFSVKFSKIGILFKRRNCFQMNVWSLFTCESFFQMRENSFYYLVFKLLEDEIQRMIDGCVFFDADAKALCLHSCSVYNRWFQYIQPHLCKQTYIAYVHRIRTNTITIIAKGRNIRC